MSALARYFHHSGVQITGYDRDKTALTKKLEAIGIDIQYDFDADMIKDPIDTVIYTPAIKPDQPEFKYFDELGIEMLKRSEALMKVLADKKVIAIAGTHGKTSTAAILAHILYYNDFGATAFVGGIMNNYQSNFIYGDSPWVIIEADEYDRSFWRLFPDIAIIQAMDADHLDIYGTEMEMVDAYKVFTLQMKTGGHLWIESGVNDNRLTTNWYNELNEREIEVHTFGLSSGDMTISSLDENEGVSKFQISESLAEYVLKMPGAHNVQNALAAIGVSEFLGLEDGDIAEAIRAFSGIQRRFQYVLRTPEIIVIDDYAHHPMEIRAAIQAARKHHPGRKLTVVFQPHLYSRTRDFMSDFAYELGEADELVLVELYPAREKPITGINSEALLSLVKLEKKYFITKEKLVAFLQTDKRNLILLLGAGDVYKLHEEIKLAYNR